MERLILIDDGTLDTVLAFESCGHEVARADASGWGETFETREDYIAWVREIFANVDGCEQCEDERNLERVRQAHREERHIEECRALGCEGAS